MRGVAHTICYLLLIFLISGCATQDSTGGVRDTGGVPGQSGVVFGRIQHEAGAFGQRMSIGSARIEWRHELTGEQFSQAPAEDGRFRWNLPVGRYEITRLEIGPGTLDFPEGQGIKFRVLPRKTVYLGSLTFLPPAFHRAGGLDIVDEYDMETRQLAEAYPVLEKKPPLKGLMFRLPPEDAGSMFVEAIVNNQVLVPFLLDTGASHTIITRATALSLGLDDWESWPWKEFNTSGGLIKSPIIEVDSIRVGQNEVEDVDVAIDVDDNLPFGLLGMNFLRHFRVVVDHQRQEVQLLR